MENNYRDMMDEVKAPESLRESVMNMTEREQATKRRPAPVRALMAAACVCALLVVGAMAAELIGGGFAQVWRGTGENSNVFFFSGESQILPAEEFSAELQALAEPYWNAEYHAEHLGFDSWEEAENFLGQKVMDNPLLAESKYSGYGITYEGKHTEGNCIVGVTINGTVGRIDVAAGYNIYLEDAGPTEVWVEAGLFMKSNLESIPLESAINEAEPSPEEADNESDADEYIVLEPESYQTANGLEAVIYDLPYFEEDGTHDWGHYSGYVYPNGIRTEVRSYYSDQENRETALAAVKKVLDAYQ
ncbi:MAG: hypothetical protein K2F83_07400 [Oscillospiraceae bacterium]|nr:hypothetical protein [Oscillospiraceae bacterium]